MDVGVKTKKLQDILTEKQINCILCKNSQTESQLLRYELKSATDGMCGFLGAHFKVILHIKERSQVKKIHLFVKGMPSSNAPKTQYIQENDFFRRESSTFELFEDFADEEFLDPSPWGVKSFIHNDNILVLPDLSVQGYRLYPATKYLDLDHVLVTLKSLARFHAAFAKYQTRINEESGNFKLHEQYACLLKDSLFTDCAWLRAAIDTTTSVLKEFSSNIEQYPSTLKESMKKWYFDACDTLRDYEDTLNVLIHKDLWANNILFKYSGAKPVNAILIDFQCAKYAPPAIDVMMFLYFTTSRSFRERYEKEVLDHYFSVFTSSIDEPTKQRLYKLNYDRQAFFSLCENFRPAGMIVPLGIGPFIYLSPHAAQEIFDNEHTFDKHFFQNRSDPILGYAKENEYYKTRVLEISEEFVERHLDKSVI